MCFSATASFTVAAATAAAGVATLRKVAKRREILLATMPLIFTIQQTVEGILWILVATENPSGWVAPLATVFVGVALVLWPLWAPLASALVEPRRARRTAMLVFATLSVPVAFYGAVGILEQPYGVTVAGHSLSYDNGTRYPPILLVAYLACTGGPLLASSDAALRSFGIVVAGGLLISALFFPGTFFSVWCFFAATGSTLLFMHWARRRQLLTSLNGATAERR
jgi:hypothetical protein